MAYKWKPSKAQRKAFAEKMKDPEQRAAYEQRKADKAAKRRAKSKFDYETAGGEYVPTFQQYEAAVKVSFGDYTEEQKTAANMIIWGYPCKEKVSHDHIHIINELIRNCLI